MHHHILVRWNHPLNSDWGTFCLTDICEESWWKLHKKKTEEQVQIIVVQLLSRIWLLWPHGLQHTRICHPSLSLGVHSKHVHRVGYAIPPTQPLPPSSPALNLFLHQGFFQWVTSSKNLKYTEQLNVMQNPTLDAGNGNRALLESWWNASMFCMLVNSIIPRSVS